MKQNKLSSAVFYIIYMLGFAVIGAQSAMLFSDEENFLVVMAELLCATLFSFLAILIHLILHEAGHLVFGLASGFHFVSFRVFNLMLQKDADGKLRFHRYTLAGTAGQCIMSPPEIKDGRMPYFRYNIGGVAVNFIIAAISAVLYFAVGGHALLSFGLMTFVITGLMIGLVNGLPFPGITNDGRNIVILSQLPAARKAFYIQMQGIVMLIKGVSVKDFPAEWFVMPTDEELQNPMCAVIAVYICDRLLDEAKYAEAQETIDMLLQKQNAFYDIHRLQLRCNALFCELTGARCSTKIDGYYDDELKKFMKAMQSYPGVIRTQYAYELLYRHDTAAAKKQLQRFEKAALTYPYQVEITSERAAIEYADSKADTADSIQS